MMTTRRSALLAAASFVVLMLASSPAPTGIPEPPECRDAYYSPSSIQYAGSTIHPANVYAVPGDSPAGDVFPASFLPSSVQIDAVHVLSENSMLFSIDRNRSVPTSSGAVSVQHNRPYLLTTSGVGIEIVPAPGWAALGLTLNSLDALHYDAANGCFSFSVATDQSHPEGGPTLRRKQVHRKCPGDPMEMLLDAGATVGAQNVDALHIDGEIVEFSTARSRYVGGKRISNQNTYRCNPDDVRKKCAPGDLVVGFDGAARGLSNLNAFSEGDGVTCDDGDACTQVDRCDNLTCIGSDLVVCQDLGNPCTEGSCNTQTGSCVVAVAPGNACDDGNECTETDQCDAQGDCQGTIPVTDGTTCDYSGPCASGSCNDGGCVGECRAVFVTGDLYPGLLGGLKGADEICETHATREDSLAPPGTYKAWLSSSSGSPLSRFEHSIDPYVRVDGTQVASDWTDLTNTENDDLDAPIQVDESGVGVTGATWTATLATGDWTGESFRSCGRWITNTSRGAQGDSTAVDVDWTEQPEFEFSDDCDSGSGRLYCFQQEVHAPCLDDTDCATPCAPGTCNLVTGACIPNPSWNIADTGCPHKRIFVSSSTQNGNLGGIAGADAICQDLADAVPLNGTFRAWIGTSSSDPIGPASDASFTKSSDPYVLVDGTIVADSWSDLTDGLLRASIDLDENGAPHASGRTWTGVRHDGTAPPFLDFDCEEWTLGTGNFARFGAVNLRDVRWTNSPLASGGYSSCAVLAHLYCVEQ